MNPSDLEKHQLETHVELCAQRYKYLEDKLEYLEKNTDELKTIVREVHDLVQQLDRRRNSQIIGWGIAIIGSLVGIVSYLFVGFINTVG